MAYGDTCIPEASGDGLPGTKPLTGRGRVRRRRRYLLARRRTLEAPLGERVQNRHDAFGIVPVRRRDIDRRRDAAFVGRNMDFDAPDLLPALRLRNRRHRQMRPMGQAMSLRDARRFPCSGPDAVKQGGDQIGRSPFQIRPTTLLTVVIAVQPPGSSYLTSSFSKSSRRSQKLSDTGVASASILHRGTRRRFMLFSETTKIRTVNDGASAASSAVVAAAL
ncbi:MAG: hypothetical protein QOH05_2884 [Acetobacteraceae bacterium]|nr:hypothetical protein [Acetobacteraceae bacterium]